jgi:hypothetical protein
MIPATEEVFTTRAASLLEHQRNLVLHPKKDAFQIDGDDSIPIQQRMRRDHVDSLVRVVDDDLVEG